KPASSPQPSPHFLGRRGRRESLLRSKQITCRTRLVPRCARPPTIDEMNSSLRLRLLTRADLPFADSVRALARWNQTLDDWQRFLATEPDGCFLAEWNGAPAGTATTTVYGPELAWIGMMLVHPEYRRRGIGRALLQRCIEHLRGRGVRCIKL